MSITLTQAEATLVGVVVAAVVALVAVFTYRQSRALLPLTPTAKLWDRQNDLDKITLQYPEVVQAFMSMANRQDPYFTAAPEAVPRDAMYFQLKALVYLQLNFFEEIHLATSASNRVSSQFEREQWDTFIFEKMRHALLKEVFTNEQGRTYTGKFVAFLNSHSQEWDMQAGEDVY